MANEENKNDILYNAVDEVFNGTVVPRVGQDTLASSIADILSTNGLGLFDAGVGIGKTYAYLIPSILAIKNGICDKIVISTSSINLQEQLRQAIEDMSKKLDFPVEYLVLKGKNNFVCRRRVENLGDKALREKYIFLIENTDHAVDRNSLSESITNANWTRINAIGCPENCQFKDDCKCVLDRKQISTMVKGIIVTNHAAYITEMNKALKDISAVVFDEAHSLYNMVIEQRKKSINSYDIDRNMSYLYDYKMFDNEMLDETYDDLNELFKMLFERAINYYDNEYSKEQPISDSLKLGFHAIKKVRTVPRERDEAEKVIVKENNETIERNRVFNKLLRDTKQSIEELLRVINNNRIAGKLPKDVWNASQFLNKVLEIIEDMGKKSHRTNIYWGTLSKVENTETRHFTLNYISHYIDKCVAETINRDIPTVLISGSLDLGDNYEYISKLLGVDTIKRNDILREIPQPSPFDYEHNALIYCPKETPDPNKNPNKYIRYLVEQIEQLTNASSGRSLVLFTSKKVMNEVFRLYNKLPHDFKVYLQTDDVPDAKTKKQFEEDESSVLFATGTFWEGIDIQGPTLSQVIITKLPFPIVDPILESRIKASKNGNETIKNEMLLKLIQGGGRLIRDKNDRGVIAILDKREIPKDIVAQRGLPLAPICDSLDDVSKFFDDENRDTSIKR